MLRAGAVIDPAAYALLRAALDANGTSTVDSVDQLEERVLYLGGGRDLGGGGRDLELSLEALLGRRAAPTLTRSRSLPLPLPLTPGALPAHCSRCPRPSPSSRLGSGLGMGSGIGLA